MSFIKTHCIGAMKNSFGRIFNTTHAIVGVMKDLLRQNYEKSLHGSPGIVANMEQRCAGIFYVGT